MKAYMVFSYSPEIQRGYPILFSASPKLVANNIFAKNNSETNTSVDVAENRY